MLLFDINKKPIELNKYETPTNYCFIFSIEPISISIIDDLVDNENKIYHVINEKNIQIGYEFNNINSYGYTIYVKENCTIKITSNLNPNKTRTLKIIHKPYNVSNELYDDLLINFNLPTYDELYGCLLDKNQYNVIRRLLLDFRHIVKYKGTKKVLDMFFRFIGFDCNQIKIFEEFLNPKTNKISIKYNQINKNQSQIKTGNYHILFYNWEDSDNKKFDKYNLPVRKHKVSNLNKLFDSIRNSIPIINKYFTIPEQTITFFGTLHSVNKPKFQTIKSDILSLHYSDINKLCKPKINLYTITEKDKFNSGHNINHLIKDNKQIDSVSFLNEVKYITENNTPQINNELFEITEQIFDDEPIDNIKLKSIKSNYGTILNLDVLCPNCYLEVSIINKKFELSKLIIEKEFIADIKRIKYITKNISEYKLRIDIWDIHNNRETYFYEYKIDNDSTKLDLNILSSNKLLDIKESYDNNIGLKVESPTWLGDLNNSNDFSKELKLTNNNRYIISDIDWGIKLMDCTDIPIKYINPWIEICMIDISKLIQSEYKSIIDKLKLTNKLLIGEIDKTIFCLSIQSGQSIYKDIYDCLIGIENDIINFESKIDLTDIIRIPINHNISIDFSKTPNVKIHNIDKNNLPKYILSIYNLLTDMEQLNIDTYKDNQIKLGDIINIQINNKYISNEMNVIWEVWDMFENRLLYTCDYETLSYRINKSTIYKIKCKLNIIGNKEIVNYMEEIISTYK